MTTSLPEQSPQQRRTARIAGWLSETLSLSYVASRTIEATIIGVGAISLLSVQGSRCWASSAVR